jgi:hypothetical protein
MNASAGVGSSCLATQCLLPDFLLVECQRQDGPLVPSKVVPVARAACG